MGYTTKIATCCYCGARTALVLDRARHELACGSCGAPLHDLKSLPKPKDGKKKTATRPHRPHHPHPMQRDRREDWHPPARPKRRKKRKNLFRKFVEEAIDVIEDIID